MCQRFKRRGERDSGAEEEVHLALVRTRNDLRTRWLEGHDEGEMRGRPRGPGDASGGTEGWHGSGEGVGGRIGFSIRIRGPGSRVEEVHTLEYAMLVPPQVPACALGGHEQHAALRDIT